MGDYDDEILRGLQELGLGDKPRYVAARGEGKGSPNSPHERVFGVRSMDEAIRKINKSVNVNTLNLSRKRK